MTVSRSMRVFAVVTVLGVLAVGCGGGDGESEGDSYKVGLILSISGAGAPFADTGIQAAKLAVKEVNDENIAGKQVSLVIVDDASDPQTASQACTRLVHQDEVDVIVGFENSANREACLPIATEANVPYLYTTGYEGKECAPNFFNIGETPEQIANPLLDYFLQQGSTKWFMGGSDYVAMNAYFDYATPYIESKGAEVVGREVQPIGENDYSAMIDQIVRSQADTVYANFIGTDMVAFVKQFRETPDTSSIGLPTNAMEESTLRAVGPGGAGMVVAWSYFADVDTPENDKFKESLNDMFGDKVVYPTIFSNEVYTAVHMWALAAKQVGSADPVKVEDALKTSVTFIAPSGPVEFNDQGHMTWTIYIGQARSDGTFEVIDSFENIDPGNQDDGDCSA